MRKNGSDNGVILYHCKDCNFYDRFPDKTARRVSKYEQVVKLLLKRNSQLRMARITGVFHPKITQLNKKPLEVISPADYQRHLAPEINERGALQAVKTIRFGFGQPWKPGAERIISVAFGECGELRAQPLFESLPIYYQQQDIFSYARQRYKFYLPRSALMSTAQLTILNASLVHFANNGVIQ